MAGKTKTKADAGSENGAIVVKKYANRRLYNTSTSSYVTLDDLSTMVKDGVDFVVFDAKSGEEITRSVLTQIIFEQEGRNGQNLLPVTFLRRLIQFYGDSLQSFVPTYLDMSLESFTNQREQIRERFTEAWGGSSPIEAFEEQARKNMQLFEQTMRMFTPFAPGATPGAPTGAPRSDASKPSAEAPDEDAKLEEMRRQLETMQQRLDQMSRQEDSAKPSEG